jgi:hypothetical protein
VGCGFSVYPNTFTNKSLTKPSWYSSSFALIMFC